MATWTQRGNIRGPQGTQGPEGPQGPQGVQGPAGADGAGIAIAGSVATYGDLPTGLTSGDAGDGYLVEADGLLYIWSGTSFPAQGSGVEFRGPAGPVGPAGDQGPAGAQGIQGETGPTGPAGADGARGTKWFDGSGVPGTLTGQATGDYYLDRDTGTYYELVP